MKRPLRTAVVGFGKMSSTYANDPLMAKHYRFATHAQVLLAHPHFEWLAVVDPAVSAKEDAKNHWQVPVVSSTVNDLGPVAKTIDVVVLATPPDSRQSILEGFPNVQAVLVEKPLGRTLQESIDFLSYCKQRHIRVQVNLWRRADRQFRHLATEGLQALIGSVQIAQGIYGNGLLNNGIHLIDFIRMLFGDVAFVEPLGQQMPFVEGPIVGDINAGFILGMTNGLSIPIQAIRFSHYREVGLSLWGETGQLAILNEGLTLSHRLRQANRAMLGEYELAFDHTLLLPSTVGDALYEMYDNLAQAMNENTPLCSPGYSALQSTRVVTAVQEALHKREGVALLEGIKNHECADIC